MNRFIYSLFLLLAIITNNTLGQQKHSFSIKGVLPWHNFLSGPSAWDEADYKTYLDDCAAQGINFIGFHNYTGGGQRYAPYVEPMIKISYKNILPDARFDNSMTARWGYVPMKVKDFAFGTSKAFNLPKGAEAFGADCSVLSRSVDEQYRSSQKLMQHVVAMAHACKMQVAMGFEFGVLPPEYYSLTNGSNFFWPGEANIVPNPTNPLAIKLFYNTIDNILDTYKGLDWVWLWLNEHSFMGIDVKQALQDAAFKELYQKESPLFTEAGADEKAKFIGVWSLQYMRLAINYIHAKNPNVKVMLGGWGGGNQLPLILKGLNRGLPKDVVFSCLNPGLGRDPQPDFLTEIAKDRKVIAVPWLEGDNQLWHYQPRVSLLKKHVQLAAAQKLDGVIAIHWRTKETKLNMQTFAHFANDPTDTSSAKTLYYNSLQKNCGKQAAQQLTGLFTELDTAKWRNDLASAEYYGYSPSWGRMSNEGKVKTNALIAEIKKAIAITVNPKYKQNLNWYKLTFEFELLLDEVGRDIAPAYNLKNKYLQSGTNAFTQDELMEANKVFAKAPVKQLFTTFAAKVSSRGELGELSSINQRLWSEYLEIQRFLKQADKPAL
jgi:hypothetical protein